MRPRLLALALLVLLAACGGPDEHPARPARDQLVGIAGVERLLVSTRRCPSPKLQVGCDFEQVTADAVVTTGGLTRGFVSFHGGPCADLGAIWYFQGSGGTWTRAQGTLRGGQRRRPVLVPQRRRPGTVRAHLDRVGRLHRRLGVPPALVRRPGRPQPRRLPLGRRQQPCHLPAGRVARRLPQQHLGDLPGLRVPHPGRPAAGDDLPGRGFVAYKNSRQHPFVAIYRAGAWSGRDLTPGAGNQQVLAVTATGGRGTVLATSEVTDRLYAVADL